MDLIHREYVHGVYMYLCKVTLLANRVKIHFLRWRIGDILILRVQDHKKTERVAKGLSGRHVECPWSYHVKEPLYRFWKKVDTYGCYRKLNFEIWPIFPAFVSLKTQIRKVFNLRVSNTHFKCFAIFRQNSLDEKDDHAERSKLFLKTISIQFHNFHTFFFFANFVLKDIQNKTIVTRNRAPVHWFTDKSYGFCSGSASLICTIYTWKE